MNNIQPVQLEDADGTTYTVLIESTNSAELLAMVETDDESDRESYGLTDIRAQLQNMHGTIRAYSWQVIGAFRQLPKGVEVEEMTLKFGMKIGGKAGIPIFTEGTAESNFEVSVKCKFPKKASADPELAK